MFEILSFSITKLIIIHLVFRIIHFLCLKIYQFSKWIKSNYNSKDLPILKLPEYLVLCFNEENSLKTKDIEQILSYCEELKIPKVKLYDYKGNIQNSKYQTLNYENSSKPLICKMYKQDPNQLSEFEEPDLMIIFSNFFSFQDFNPLSIRFTEFLQCTNTNLSFKDFQNLIAYYSHTKQRYGS